MELSFQLEEEDYRAYARYGQARVVRAANVRSKLRFYMWLIGILPPASLGMFFVYLGDGGWPLSKPLSLSASLLVTWVVILFACLYRYQALVLDQYMLPDSVAFQPQRLRLHEQGITNSRSTVTCEYDWGAFRSVEETEELLILILDISQALCIPRRVFDSREHEELFLKLAREHISKVER